MPGWHLSRKDVIVICITKFPKHSGLKQGTFSIMCEYKRAQIREKGMSEQKHTDGVRHSGSYVLYFMGAVNICMNERTNE